MGGKRDVVTIATPLSHTCNFFRRSCGPLLVRRLTLLVSRPKLGREGRCWSAGLRCWSAGQFQGLVQPAKLCRPEHHRPGVFCTLVLLSGDGDYSYMLSKIKAAGGRGYCSRGCRLKGLMQPWLEVEGADAAVAFG